MQMLYDSDSYTVMQFDMPAAGGGDAAPRDGYEIVDKRARRESFIEGALARSFRDGVQALADTDPSVEDFDDYIERFAQLSQQPLLLH